MADPGDARQQAAERAEQILARGSEWYDAGEEQPLAKQIIEALAGDVIASAERERLLLVRVQEADDESLANAKIAAAYAERVQETEGALRAFVDAFWRETDGSDYAFVWRTSFTKAQFDALLGARAVLGEPSEEKPL